MGRWTIRLDRPAQKQLRSLGTVEQKRLQSFLSIRLAERDDPRDLGEALTGPLKGLWKFRAGPYRLIASIDDRELVVLVIRIGHRREVYR